ncbi:MAG: L,D-transpeptidase family protein [Hyphomicrobiaceae bacterium]|nr:L,D-transpeptidase family protein [Hyphomicrobiaceae bacterium]
MKTLLRVASIAVFTAGYSFQADAEQKDDVESEVTASIAEPSTENVKPPAIAEESFDQAIASLVHDEIGEASDGKDRKTLVHQALRAFYAGSAATPIWVGENGPNQKARDAAKEIEAADAYGLNPKDYDLPDVTSTARSREALAKIELKMTHAVLGYAHHAKAGRIKPAKVGHRLNNPVSLENPRAFLESLRTEDDVVARLRDLHPKHKQFVQLKKKLAALRGHGDGKPQVQIPDGPALRTGTKHPHVALLRKRLSVSAPDETKANTFDDSVKTAVVKFQKGKGLKADGVVGNGTRRALNGQSNEQLAVRILANMERWRWLPDDMAGEAGIFVWANIPEFRTRIVQAGKTVFDERVIVGKTNKKTPVFSDKMEWIEFHPTWYVPNSIKVEDIGPSLRRPTSSVVDRYHLKISCGRHGSDWRKIDWNVVNIRNCSVTQPPGAKSVLGDFKFKFPNGHDVYMHDTPTKRLFGTTTRTYSHGCVRIQNPRRMAEILLEHDKGMTSARVGQILKGPKRLHTEKLSKHVPVHITYFTTVFDKEGNFRTRSDYYGHDKRLAQALTGKGHLLPAPVIAVSRKRTPRRRTRTAQETPWTNAFSAN